VCVCVCELHAYELQGIRGLSRCVWGFSIQVNGYQVNVAFAVDASIQHMRAALLDHAQYLSEHGFSRAAHSARIALGAPL